MFQALKKKRKSGTHGVAREEEDGGDEESRRQSRFLVVSVAKPRPLAHGIPPENLRDFDGLNLA
jgi:hypothetical protein